MSSMFKFPQFRFNNVPKPQVVSTEPKLPPELEKIIFSYAHHNHPEDVKNLTFVARRVEEWLCSSIFKVTLLLSGHQSPLKRLTLWTFLRYGKYITHLALNLSILKNSQNETLLQSFFNLRRNSVPRLLLNVLTACPNLVNFWIFTNELAYSRKFFPVFSPLITRLSIQLSLLLRQLSLKMKKSKAEESHPLFPAITQILVFGNPFGDKEEDLHSLVLSIHFPNLTHFALTNHNAISQKDGMRLTLERCTKLELVVVMRLIRYPDSRPLLGLDDSRIVDLAMSCQAIEPWKAAVRGEGPDIWEMANRHRVVTRSKGTRRV